MDGIQVEVTMKTFRRIIFVSLCLLLNAMWISPVYADKPERYEFSISASRINDTSCSFPILAEAQLYYRDTIYFDKTGAEKMTLEYTHHILTYTNLTNGVSVSGAQVRTHMFAPTQFNADGSITFDGEVHGAELRIVKPGTGVVALSAGRFFFHTRFAADGTLLEKDLIPLAGHADALYPALCEALAS
jgi:hypothetical protein